MDPELSREQRGAAGKTGRVRGIDILEHDRVGGDAVDVRGRAAQVAVAAEMVGSERVDIDVQQSHCSQSIWIAFSAQPGDVRQRRSGSTAGSMDQRTLRV